jgi:hypothetical protein
MEGAGLFFVRIIMSGSKPHPYHIVLNNKGMNPTSYPFYVKWLKWLLQHTEKITYLEIGVLYGGTIEKTMKNVFRPQDTVIGIDLFESYPRYRRASSHGGSYTSRELVTRRLNEAGLTDFTLLVGDSNKVLPTIDPIEDGFIYIDGNHMFEPCRDDLLHVCDKTERGVIVLHDSQRKEWGVWKVCDEVAPKLGLKLLEKTRDSHFFLKGEYINESS